jgi:hydrogenase nickel incorporation protein HypA/HybF
MHEYTVVSELIDSLLPRLEKISGKIVSVHLKKGELRILSDWALRNAFEMLAEGTKLEGAQLKIENVAVSLRCRVCGYEGKGKAVGDDTFHFSIPVLTCPRCRSPVEILSGRELYVEEVRVVETTSSSTEKGR